MQGDTQLGKPISFYTSIKEVAHEGTEIVNIEDTGFKETPFIKNCIPDKKQKTTSLIRYPDVSEYVYSSEDIKNGILYLPKISTESITKRRALLARLELEEQGRNYKEEHAEINAKTAEYYKELKKQTDEIIKQKTAIEDNERRIIGLALGVASSFTGLPINSLFTVRAFSIRKTKHDNSALMVLREEDNKLYYAGAYFKFIYTKYKTLWKDYNNGVLGFINFKSILTVQIEKYEHDKSNNKIPKFKTIVSLDTRINITDIREELNERIGHINLEIVNITLQKLNTFKPSTAIKAEDILEPNKEYNITHLDTAIYRSKKQHFIIVKEHPNVIIKANEFLNNAFCDNPMYFIIKFKTLEQKYNSSRNKELDVNIKKKDKKQKFNILLSI